MLMIFAAVALSACAGNGSTADASGMFEATTATFQPFRTWTAFQSAGPPASAWPNNPEVLGPRTQYINKLPPHGATAFPVGTVIVEVRQDTGKIFAAVKRGGGFNSAGQIDWEDFGLSEGASGAVQIDWSDSPPSGEAYGADPNSCNNCHVTCRDNDFVCSAQLQLSRF